MFSRSTLYGKGIYYINIDEIPGELSRKNMISLRVKVILYSDFAMGIHSRSRLICCKQREVLVNKLVDKSQGNSRENPLKKKLMDRLHIPPYLFLSQEDDDDVTDIGKHDFRWVLLHHMLSNANQSHLLCFLSTPYSFSISFSHSFLKPQFQYSLSSD